MEAHTKISRVRCISFATKVRGAHASSSPLGARDLIPGVRCRNAGFGGSTRAQSRALRPARGPCLALKHPGDGDLVFLTLRPSAPSPVPGTEAISVQ